ncbi:MAG TPA: ubiquinone/menaquinone biosynthesis methyltransferase, partial [Bacteroidota bacterium]|nr:ubiquinone/menaquinone biosynthesis methyltransferase [Bacteroidota bacterium]
MSDMNGKNINSAIAPPKEVQAMFDAIAPRYDLLNHLLSFGLDYGWRKKAIAMLEPKRGGRFLDIAAGSGDMSIEAQRLEPRLVVASDFAEQMLRALQTKLKKTSSTGVSLASCDALRLPFPNASFDATMTAFGIRNFSDRLASLKEMRRVLVPGGIALILELTEPKGIFRPLFRIYGRTILPLLGRIISGSNFAYSYLPASIAKFPEAEEF